ncbi:MAG: T9SS type A sorting domain-containing protein, partial [Thaumarchaeota archaeon]|nr:T9SS type A sorting domain-containing protein [Nitrososphaerota archaeon]
SNVTLKIYDILGREVRTLVEGNQVAGSHSVTFDGRALASGVYYCRIDARGLDGEEFTSTRKMLLMK